jgi:AraC-like DNA-binding protein
MRSIDQSLILTELLLVPGGEWAPRIPDWGLVTVSRGAGYWIGTSVSYDLEEGSVLVLNRQAQGLIRSSQLGELLVSYFLVHTDALSGLVTLGEQATLEKAARDPARCVRIFPGSSSLAEDFRRLCHSSNPNALRERVRRLDLFVRIFEEQLGMRGSAQHTLEGAKARMEAIMGRMPATELMELDFTELAARVGCSPRHLSRLFHEVVGVSFREKQTQVRLGKAQKLLMNTRSKVFEIALESGYQSLSLFNLTFKRYFGVTPAQWRLQPVKGKVATKTGRLDFCNGH